MLYEIISYTHSSSRQEKKSSKFHFSLTFKKPVSDLCKCMAIVSSDDCTTNPLRQSYRDD